jgi:flavorubredoxin
MVTYLEEARILFSCDFYGSHIASSDLFVTDQGRVYEAAKRYFAEIMMPFRSVIEKNIDKLKSYDIQMIAPSHGQIHDRPSWIMDAYRDWVSGPRRNTVVLPYVTMHGSTKLMVDYLSAALVEKGVRVELFNLTVTDIGKLAMALVDAATIVVGTPTVLAGPHPLAAYAAFLANALRPQTKFLSIIGSYGWGGKTVETLAAMIPNLKVEVIAPVLCKGKPSAKDFQALDTLALAISKKHQDLNLN